MKIGDLIKHKKAKSTALVLDTFVGKNSDSLTHPIEWARVLFSGDSRITTVPFKLLKENWKVMNGKI